MPRRFALLAATALLSGGLSAAALADPSPTAVQHRNVPVCGPPAAGFAHCHAVLHQAVNANGKPTPDASSPSGLSPAQVRAAYGFSTTSTGAGKTIAIVDAYDAPNIESDLAVFSSAFGLPACTTANGCFTKVNQTGQTHYPRVNSGWALEIALDVEWAHAIAPGAHILLVEASSNSFTNLMAAEDYAKAHAQYVSNSWGGSEFSSESSYDSHFARTGVAFFVSSGDNGEPAEYPSASPNVVSVGGTSLSFAADGSITETGWSGSGGGCSAYEAPPPGQNTGSVNCAGKRATPDISLDADPNSGVSVYDSTSYSGQSGWFTVGGTSASAPMTAANAAVTGAISGPSSVYGNLLHYDVIAGNNGASAGPGYDLVTGIGSWNNGVARVDPTGGGDGGGGGGGGVGVVDVHSDGISYSASGGGKTLVISVHVVDSSAANVGGATVSINLAGPNVTASGSATTGSNGTASFRLSHAQHGSYTTTITDISGTNLHWDGTGTTSFTGNF